MQQGFFIDKIAGYTKLVAVLATAWEYQVKFLGIEVVAYFNVGNFSFDVSPTASIN